ncbi:MAG TPA: hypothetical protein VMM85_01690 [Methylomirabilota bacterium]|nr:hypothetical protein [Methylomirabilota bacterium]
MSDLMMLSRVDAAASAVGAALIRVDAPSELLPQVDLVLVDWSARRPGWADALVAWRDSAPDARIVLYGRHTDLEAHAAARAAGLGPMWARSKLVAELPSLVSG